VIEGPPPMMAGSPSILSMFTRSLVANLAATVIRNVEITGTIPVGSARG